MKGTAAVWLRNFLYFRKSLIATFFWAAFEPILYLFAIGFSLGKSIGNFEGVSYVEFYVPALLTSTAMMVGYLESTFGSYTKMTYQSTYKTIFLTPVAAHEIVLGEVIWCASKAMFGFVCVAAVAGAFGALHTANAGLVFLILFLTGLVFASLGMLVSTFVKNYDQFTYTVSGLIVPMSLFSGTFFPLENLPTWLQWIAQALPLTHSVKIVRGLMLETLKPADALIATVYLLVLLAVGLYFAIARVTKRLEN